MPEKDTSALDPDFRSKKNSNGDNFCNASELYDFLGDLVQKKYSGVVEIQLKRGSIKRWAKMSKFRRMGGGIVK